VLDDLQDLSGNVSTQQEFLATLDARIDEHRPVLVASRASPAELVHLLPGLQSRLVAGLAVPIAEPGTETRHAIVSRFLEDHGLQMTDEAEQLLAVSSRGVTRRLRTVGELNGALLELAQCPEQPISATTIRQLLRRPTPGLNLTLRQITRQTARHFQLRSTELVGASRRQSTVRARGVAMYLARRLLGTSLEDLGTHFGGRDHSTVMHALRRTENDIRLEPVVQQAIEDITEQLGTSPP
jgi:chromosomal replication initiator protein